MFLVTMFTHRPSFALIDSHSVLKISFMLFPKQVKPLQGRISQDPMRGCSSTGISAHNHVLSSRKYGGARTAPHRILRKSSFCGAKMLLSAPSMHEQFARCYRRRKCPRSSPLKTLYLKMWLTLNKGLK
jgi:hypothetical protein